jgi:uncharacterized membrane protein
MTDFMVTLASLVFLVIAVVISVLFPDNPSTQKFVIALILWFLFLGPLGWVEHRIPGLVKKGSRAAPIWRYGFLIVEIALILVGAMYFVRALA